MKKKLISTPKKAQKLAMRDLSPLVEQSGKVKAGVRVIRSKRK